MRFLCISVFPCINILNWYRTEKLGKKFRLWIDWDSVVGTVTSLRAGQARVQNQVGVKVFFFFKTIQKKHEARPGCYSIGIWVLSRG
jgi:hypothetical protein